MSRSKKSFAISLLTIILVSSTLMLRERPSGKSTEPIEVYEISQEMENVVAAPSPLTPQNITIDAKSNLVALGGVDAYGEPASKYTVDRMYAYYEGVVLEADPQTLDVVRGALEKMSGYISYRYAQDERAVYYEGEPLRGVVPASFRVIENGRGWHSYGTDDGTVYFGAQPIEGADPKTFMILHTSVWEGCAYAAYSKDAAHVYFASSTSVRVELADAATFTALIHGYGKDRRGYYKGVTYIGRELDQQELVCESG
jgi:hypothetical protein